MQLLFITESLINRILYIRNSFFFLFSPWWPYKLIDNLEQQKAENERTW